MLNSSSVCSRNSNVLATLESDIMDAADDLADCIEDQARHSHVIQRLARVMALGMQYASAVHLDIVLDKEVRRNLAEGT